MTFIIPKSNPPRFKFNIGQLVEVIGDCDDDYEIAYIGEVGRVHQRLVACDANGCRNDYLVKFSDEGIGHYVESMLMRYVEPFAQTLEDCEI